MRCRTAVDAPFVVDVSGNKQIEQPIAIVIAEAGSCGRFSQSDAGLLGDIGERSIVIVAIEAIVAEIGDVEIGPSVVVIVGDGTAVTPAIVGNAGKLATLVNVPS